MSLQPVAGIPSIPPTPSLLTAARRLPEGMVWKTGLSFRDTAASSAVSGWPYAPGADHADKAGAGTPDIPEFLPFMLYLPVECSDVTWATEEDLVAEARSDLEAMTAWGIARDLWTGETVNAGGYSNNPSLQRPDPAAWFDASNTLLTGTVDPVDGLGLLAESYQAITHGKGGLTFHVPSALVPYLIARGVIKQQGDLYVGPLGSVVSPGPGYPRIGASGPKTAAANSGATASTGESWIFATGPVEYATGEIRILPEKEAARWLGAGRTNIWQVWAERMVIYRFNTSAVVAQKVEIPETGGA